MVGFSGTVKYKDIYPHGGPVQAYTDGWQLETGLQTYRSGGPVRVLQLSTFSSGTGLSHAGAGVKGKKK